MKSHVRKLNRSTFECLWYFIARSVDAILNITAIILKAMVHCETQTWLRSAFVSFLFIRICKLIWQLFIHNKMCRVNYKVFSSWTLPKNPPPHLNQQHFAVFWSQSFCSQIIRPRTEQKSMVAWLMDEFGKKFVRLLFNIVYMFAIWHRSKRLVVRWYQYGGFIARMCFFLYCFNLVYFNRANRFLKLVLSYKKWWPFDYILR